MLKTHENSPGWYAEHNPDTVKSGNAQAGCAEQMKAAEPEREGERECACVRAWAGTGGKWLCSLSFSLASFY